MSDQSNSAAERSAHVTRGEKPAPAEWPVVRMPDGTWKLKSVVALETRIAALEAAVIQCRTLSAMLTPQANRIAELEEALQDMSKHVWRGDWDKLKPETRALLAQKK